MNRAARGLLLVGALLSGVLAADAVLARGEDPDWPCVQRLVPHLTASGVWSGPALPEGEAWREAPDIAALVARITPRGVTAEAGTEAIEAFAAPLDSAARRDKLPLLLSALLYESNRARAGLIERLKAFAQRQRALAAVINQSAAALDAIPVDATGEVAAWREELAQRHYWETKAFQDAERTLRYACEAPVRLEARFGAYARAIEAALPPEAEGTR